MSDAIPEDKVKTDMIHCEPRLAGPIEFNAFLRKTLVSLILLLGKLKRNPSSQCIKSSIRWSNVKQAKKEITLTLCVGMYYNNVIPKVWAQADIIST